MINVDNVRAAICSALAPGHFFVAEPGRLRVEHAAAEEVAWELFRGHLLDEFHSTCTKQFASWHTYVDEGQAPAEAPLLSLYWDRDAQRVFVVRRILRHAFEAYEDTPGVILSRPVQKWIRELVGTIDLTRISRDKLGAEIRTYMYLAVIGASRLPITSLESPLPAFSLGQFAYFPNVKSDGDGSWLDPVAMLMSALAANDSPLELAKVLESALRAVEDGELPRIARVMDDVAGTRPLGSHRVSNIVRALFRNVALSPYTNFSDRLIEMLLALNKSDTAPAAQIADLIGDMLRQLCRHLTAFDLTTFHNSGANYPDALFLDALLKAYLHMIANKRELFVDQPNDSDSLRRAKRLRRRALRQACLVRKHYEGHPVPDAPTSQGENVRVLPAPFVRVPEEQILQSARRRRTLFADEPLEAVLCPAGQEALRASLDDLNNRAELGDLGMAYFLDRPLGVAKRPGEVDRTPLVSYVAFSRGIVKRRIGQLQAVGWITVGEHDRLIAATDALVIAGIPAASIEAGERPGVVSLADARTAAPDFEFLRTTRQSFDELQGIYDWSSVDDVLARSPSLGDVLVVPHAPKDNAGRAPTLRIHDFQGRLRIELGFPIGPDGAIDYIEQGGVEVARRLRVLGIWEQGSGDRLVRRDFADQEVWLTLRT